MEISKKKLVAGLGIRVALLFLIAFGVLAFSAYYAVSKNFQTMLTDYTVTLIESMVRQGVISIENELKSSQEIASDLAGSFNAPENMNELDFPEESSVPGVQRFVYVTENKSVASDGRHRDISGRQDIAEAFEGKEAMYGPYFNEENEYVICYSAPVFREGEIAGVLSLEKDGYYFCDLIENIRFIDSGEAYIINKEGTDIAVSMQEHINWVNDGYNARRLLEKGDDDVARSVMELEEKGLNGESGAGTYYWDDGLCYVVYAPIPSAGWVLLAGLRQEELQQMMRTMLFSSITNGPILQVSIVMFMLLTILITVWLVTSLRKSAEINEKLNIIANYDSLTGIKNRNSYDAALIALSGGGLRSFACIYIDANGLHEINNRLGHQAGDVMLRSVADELQRIFCKDDVYRIGGDEFVVFCRDQDEKDVSARAEIVRKNLMEQGYEISIGVNWQDKDINVRTVIGLAEDAMQNDKRQFYEGSGKERQLRTLNEAMEKMVLEKQDADTFLSVLAPEFMGVYFVDLGSDTIRHLFIPRYFEEMLRESEDIFSKALLLYADRIVKSEYQKQFIKFCAYNNLETQLKRNAAPEFSYQKMDGSWITLRILKFKTYTEQMRETLWIFEANDKPLDNPSKI